MAKNLFIDGQKYSIKMSEQDDGSIDICIDALHSPYICKFTNKGELLLYADVNPVFNRSKESKYIIVKKEMD